MSTLWPEMTGVCLLSYLDLWALAKLHNTTVTDILSANGLSGEEDIPRDRLLLIPKKR